MEQLTFGIPILICVPHPFPHYNISKNCTTKKDFYFNKYFCFWNFYVGTYTSYGRYVPSGMLFSLRQEEKLSESN